MDGMLFFVALFKGEVRSGRRAHALTPCRDLCVMEK
uniref:Uncharacterized protein n=1 Tax=Anguilla anguilla TaxID=7936 RepID=A0A0E9T4A3_ANGAN